MFTFRILLFRIILALPLLNEFDDGALLGVIYLNFALSGCRHQAGSW